MANYSQRTVRTIRHETVLPSPTNWAELGKATSSIQQQIRAAGIDPDYDDIVTIEARDEEIVLYWTEEEKVDE